MNGKIREVLFPPNETGVFNTFTTIGTMYSFFIIALKMDMTMLFRISKSAWAIGLAGTIVPWVTVLSLFYTQLNYLPAGLHPKVIPFFLSAYVSLTFFPMVGYALDELNLKTSELGHLAMSSALVTEVFQWFFAFVLAAFKQTNLEQAIETCVSSTIVVLFTIYAIRPALISVIKRTPEGTEVDEVYVVLILVGVLFMGFITDLTGSSIMYGPLILGYVIPDGPPLGSILVEKTECFVSEILLPLFFLRVGFELDLCSIQNWRVALIFMFILFMGYFAKFLGVLLASLAFKLRPTYAFVLGLLMNSKGIVEMILYFRLKKDHVSLHFCPFYPFSILSSLYIKENVID